MSEVGRGWQKLILTPVLSLTSVDSLRSSLNLFSSFLVFIQQMLLEHVLGSRPYAQSWEYGSIVGWDPWKADSEMEISVQGSGYRGLSGSIHMERRWPSRIRQREEEEGSSRVSVKPQPNSSAAVKMRYAFKGTLNWGEGLSLWSPLHSGTIYWLPWGVGMILVEACPFLRRTASWWLWVVMLPSSGRRQKSFFPEGRSGRCITTLLQPVRKADNYPYPMKER